MKIIKKAIRSKFPRTYHVIKGSVKNVSFFFQYNIFRKPIKTRDELPFFINYLGYTGPISKGVEIGTWKGSFSATILKSSRLSILYSIDPWQKFNTSDYIDTDNVSQIEFEAIYGHAKNTLDRFGQRSQVMRMCSLEASKEFKDHALDFIYIDANHSYEKCLEDLNLWWPKLRRGGLFAGHDYLDGDLPEGRFGVKSAVNEFLRARPHQLFVTPEDWPTWYFIKKND